MIELRKIKDANGNSFIGGHTDFGENLIGIGGHFYDKENEIKFGQVADGNSDKINSVLEKNGVN